MTELPPDVRDRAARAAREAVIAGKPWRLVPESEKAELLAVVDAVAEVLAAAEPLGELRIKYADAQARRAFEAETEQNRLRARVDLLTAALTGLCDVYHVRPLDELLDGEETVSEDDGPKFAAWVNAQAALSATPTTPVPHTCQLPDIATVREPSSFNDRRWDCPVCDARWIAMGRMVGRRSRYEWRQMPVTKTAAPTESED